MGVAPKPLQPRLSSPVEYRYSFLTRSIPWVVTYVLDHVPYVGPVFFHCLLKTLRSCRCLSSHIASTSHSHPARHSILSTRNRLQIPRFPSNPRVSTVQFGLYAVVNCVVGALPSLQQAMLVAASAPPVNPPEVPCCGGWLLIPIATLRAYT